MSSVSRRAVASVAVIAALLAATLGAAPAGPLRVCADPNNMPFSNVRGEGFENKIAEMVARDIGRPISYFWSPQRRGFVRNTLSAERCDVVMGVPAHYELLQPTRPYYRSSYVFVSRHDRGLRVRSFDDPRLKTLRIGIQLTGDDYANPPAAQAFASRHIINNIRGYTVYGDYSKEDPQRAVVEAVARGEVDVAVVWGPQAGYFGRHAGVPIDLTPVAPPRDGVLPFRFDIAMGVRRGDAALRATLDRIIVRRRAEIRRILEEYGVPLV
jgi:mxaJ protein